MSHPQNQGNTRRGSFGFDASPPRVGVRSSTPMQDFIIQQHPNGAIYDGETIDSLPVDGNTATTTTRYDDGDSQASDDSGLGHTRLFVIIEQGTPQPIENRQLSVTEAAERNEMMEQTWERIRKWLWDHPDAEERQAAATVRGSQDATPLHNVCKLNNPPTDVVQALIDSAPETVAWIDINGWLPLHYACLNGASREVLLILTEAYPEGKTKQDGQNRTPLHFYLGQQLGNSVTMAANMKILSDSGAAELPDSSGMLPMHYACAYGVNPAVLKVLKDAYPDSLVAKENNGRTPMHLGMVNAHRDASPEVMSFLLENGGADLVNVRDHNGYLPLHLLAHGLKGSHGLPGQQQNNVAECLKMYLGAEPMASADFLRALQDLPGWLQDVAVVTPHVRNTLNKKIVKRLPTAILMMDGYILLLIIIFFEIATSQHIDARFTNTESDDFRPLIILFVGGTYFLLRELIQFISLWSLGSITSWFADQTNWLDMIVIILVYHYSVIMVTDSTNISHEEFRSGVAFTKGILWLDVIYFLKNTLVDFAVFVGGVFYVLKRLAAFLLAVGVILLAFAQMFFFVYTDTTICDDTDGNCSFPHCTFGGSLLKVYTMMMGEIGDETRYETFLVAQILYVIYAFLVVILLSNVLIAIVTDSYEIIQNDRAAIVFWSNRLDFVAEIDAVSYGFLRRLSFMTGDKASMHIQESNYGIGGGGGLVTNAAAAADARRNSNKKEGGFFFRTWEGIAQLFDQNLHDDIARSPQNIEFWCYFFFQGFAVVVVIPVWIILGIVSAGLLWPPQIREYLFVQKETAASRADVEKEKLGQLKEIQSDVKALRGELKREIGFDREEMMRLKHEVETTQNDFLSDLQQVRELMTTLLDAGRQRAGR